ncbi:MAG: CvpA family protein [Candidatus Buchananbacteria bacterium]
MTFTILDVALMVIVFFFVGFGYAVGAIQTFGGIVGLALGVFAAGQWYEVVAGWLSPFFMGADNWALIVAFVLIFIIIDRVVAIIFALLNKAYDLISFVPFLKTFNRLIGAVLGLVEGALICGLLIFISARYPVNEWLSSEIVASPVAAWVVSLTNVVLWLVPEAVRRLQALI